MATQWQPVSLVSDCVLKVVRAYRSKGFVDLTYGILRSVHSDRDNVRYLVDNGISSEWFPFCDVQVEILGGGYREPTADDQGKMVDVRNSENDQWVSREFVTRLAKPLGAAAFLAWSESHSHISTWQQSRIRCDGV